MMKSVLLQAFTRQKVDSYIECLCPSSSGRSSRESVFEKYNPNYLFDNDSCIAYYYGRDLCLL